MKGLINFESINRRTLKSLGLYYKWLFYKERKSPTASMLKMRKLYSRFINPGDLCFDIGANMGSRVASFLVLKAKVVAVEPQEICMKELKKTFRNQPVYFEKKGVGAKEGVEEMFIANNSLISSFSKSWIEVMKTKHQKNNWDKSEQVEITTLDLLIEKYGIPDFIKIDTEGYELEVLKGLSRPVKSLSVEYTLPDPQQKTQASLDLLEKLYDQKALYNISVEETYDLKFPEWINIEEMKQLLNGPGFSSENFGGYGDIYVIAGK
jgi:FkbM family methyltransferase